jgi:lipopolysaccharide/colanic/teichoic acid biosynthesis glycosyltransferase
MNRNLVYYFNLLKIIPENITTKIDTTLKRLLDITISIVGLLILLPFLILIGILIRFETRGPVIYRGLRVGKGNKIFKIVKFRTMYENDKSYNGPKVTFDKDPRITKIGHWLRDTKINELPQFWNVLIGDMSLVGPRPEDPEIVAKWTEEERKNILSVRPGITSPASVVYHNEEKMLSLQNLLGVYLNDIVPDKIRLDMLYIKNRSFFVDLDILFLTFLILIPRIFENSIPESAFFSGWINKLVNRFLLWLVVDLITVSLSIVITGLLWRSQNPLNWGIVPLFFFSITLASIFSGVNALLRLDRVVWSRATILDAMKLIVSSGSVTLIMIIADILLGKYQWLPYPALPESMIIFIGLFTMIGYVSTRFRQKIVDALFHNWSSFQNSTRAFGERVLIVGCDEGSEIILWLLRRNSFNYSFSIIGLVDDDPNLIGMNIDGYKVLGETKCLPELIEKYNIGLVICTKDGKLKQFCQLLLNKKKYPLLRVIHFEDIVGSFYNKLIQPITEIDYTMWNTVLKERNSNHE